MLRITKLIDIFMTFRKFHQLSISTYVWNPLKTDVKQMLTNKTDFKQTFSS